ncbi:zinc-dependent alcohol dehydrogenase family protein [Streptomyces sp. NBC_00841]|uniref:zinc-dependent alcohol dehydrogenase family protein n=1 Tax=unclassified Streptomyces TaxID=2593676 RepID=UPI0022501675|nr:MULTISPECIES: zinc-dependent alcohol dehydrogenase family protein [unclassified Streptomyces]MCX4536939.1 zinc-dependent alcohol dehydrogenase family protein [Streptomyces sp. NBC_01669]WRZ97808.1 zinc-dependent alcohol dehydrogenase family protein [Streptomyces sp. NBC_00841]
MRAAIVEAPGKVSVTSLPDPTPGPREVVVDVAACGLCGTDLHILQGEFAPTLPIVPGHEFAGEVVGIGAEVTELSIGDQVAVDPSLHCHECRSCRAGRGNLCDRWAAIGVTVPGGAAEYALAPVANCVRLPEHIDARDAALIEPLSCAVRGYDVLSGTLGAQVLIYGSGTMGLMMLELAKHTGAATVDIVDINPERLYTARELGVSGSASAAAELERPGGWDVVVDATGNAAAIQDGLRRVAKGGTFLQFGVADYATTAIIEPYKIYNQEITITGSMAVLHSFERAAALFATGILDPGVFISDRLPLEQYPQAIDRFKAGQGRKIVVQP